ncbi:MAG: CHAT domain-containing protein, partial [Bacteroidota bacterium]
KKISIGTDKKILFLSANPSDSSRLRVNDEIKRVEEELRKGLQRQNFSLIKKVAIGIDGLQQAILDEKPEIVHFSGHGSSPNYLSQSLETKPGRFISSKIEDGYGIVLEGENGTSEIVSNSAMADLMSLFKRDLKCVILNACYTDTLAKGIIDYIPYVIGTKRAIPDKAAIVFSVGFYKALAAGEDYKVAFKLGKNSIDFHNFDGDLVVMRVNASLERELNFKKEV